MRFRTNQNISVILLAILACSNFIGGAVQANVINIAPIYGTASASGFLSHRPPELAIDSDPLSLWNDIRHGTEIDPSWLIVDLHNLYPVVEVILQSPDNDNTFLGFSNVYRFSVSINGSAWTPIATGTLLDSHDPVEYSDVIPIPSAHSVFRFAQYEVVGGTHWGHLGEMEIYADVAAVPEPATISLLVVGLVGIMFVRRRRYMSWLFAASASR